MFFCFFINNTLFCIEFGVGLSSVIKKNVKKLDEKILNEQQNFLLQQEEWPKVNKNPKFEYQAFNMCAWGKDWFSDRELVKKAMKFILEEGANLIILDWAVNFDDNGSIIPLENSLHPYWEDIEWIVDKAKSLELYVMLKPHTTLSNNAMNRNIWNTEVSVSSFNPTKFFNDYKIYISSLCDFAQKHNVDFLCIGTEMNHLDWQQEYRDYWVDLIETVRTKFSGKITYDALFNRNYRNVKDIEEVIFLDKLDFIGISLYVPVTTDDDANVETIKQGWRKDLGEVYGGGGWFEIDDVVQYLYDIVVSSYNKKLMAVEGGYQSKGQGGLFDVGKTSFTYAHYDLQSRGIEGYLSVMGEENDKGWILGVSIWDITPYMISEQNLQTPYHQQEFSVYQKPAAEVVKQHYYKLK